MKFIVYSVVIHFFVILILGWNPYFDGGITHAKSKWDDSQELSVNIISDDTQQVSISRLQSTNHLSVSSSNKEPSEEKKVGHKFPDAGKGAIKAASSNRLTEKMGNKRPLPQNDIDQGYIPAGRLTRLPAPITLVDLNVHSITSQARSGKIELTLFIEADGTVTNIVGSREYGNASDFPSLVAAQFKSARFSPGEIGGRKVKSQITIIVLSEAA